MAQKLSFYKFDCLNNPFGTVFNPISIASLLHQSIENNYIPFFVKTEDLIFDYGLHSKFASTDEAQLKERNTLLFERTHSYLLKKNCTLIITLGTAWVYQHKETGQLVANCHKQPSQLFEKKLLSIDEMYQALLLVLKQCVALNPSIKCIVTVSPVRHTKEGIPNNMLSKSLLRVLCHQLEEAMGDSVYYFPSYEWMMDDLREYRYYESDLIHPNQQAIDYIWTQFKNWSMPVSLVDALSEWESIQLAMAHHPHHAQSLSYIHFLNQLLEKLLQFKHWQCDAEIAIVKEKLLNAQQK
jgi:hypothetical protein